MFAGSLARSVSLVAAAGCAACAGNSAPRGWLPKAEEAQVVAYGGWIELTCEENGGRRRSQGELIAVTADSVWVLEERGGVVMATAAVRTGKLTAYAAQTGNAATWTVVGTLATISNGAFLIFTAPMWIIGGTLVTGNESRAPERSHPSLTWEGLAPYARFPQGMPAGVELMALRSKNDYEPRTATGNR